MAESRAGVAGWSGNGTAEFRFVIKNEGLGLWLRQEFEGQVYPEAQINQKSCIVIMLFGPKNIIL